jgi:hypothetical protein
MGAPWFTRRVHNTPVPKGFKLLIRLKHIYNF